MTISKIRYLILLALVFIVISGCQTNDNNELENNNEITTENKENDDIVDNEANNLVNDENNEENNDNEYNHGNEETNTVITDDMMEDLSVIKLVNKEYHLTADDAPGDLITVDVPTILDNPEVNQLRKEAANALKEMFNEAKKDDIYLYARSGYRSFETQKSLFQSYVDRNGEEAANRYSARPGQSEHQTGLVMDVTSESVSYQLQENFGETNEGQWVQEHAYKFGFIIRYPQDKEHITGYIYEPWHLRYLGVDMATNVFQSGLTYEEFIEMEDIMDVVTQ